MDWRHSFAEMEREHVSQIQRWAKIRATVSFDVFGERMFPHEMDEAEIREAARQEAHKDLQRAINEWNHNETTRKRRRGEM